MKHKITLTTEECFEVVEILNNYVQNRNVDKSLLSAYKKLNVKVPNVDCNYYYEIPTFKPRIKNFEPRKDKQ